MSQYFRRHQILVALLSIWMSVYFSVIVRLLDYLKFISSIYESVFLPLIGLCIGLLLGKTSFIKLTGVFKIVILMLVLLIVGISINSAHLTLIAVGFTFLLVGIALRLLSQNIPASKLYTYESAGYLFGLIFVQLAIPALGIETLFVILLLTMVLLELNFFKVRIWFSLLITMLFSIGLMAKSSYSLSIYNLASDINVKNKTYKDTVKNASYAFRSGQGTYLDTIWTSGDRIDVFNLRNRKTLYFSNALYSVIPEDIPQNFPNHNRHSSRALLLGMGGGSELRQFEDAGYRNSTALEIYPELVSELKNKYIPNLISRNNIIVQDLKFFIKETNRKFDIIMHSFPDLVAKVDSSGWPIENATYSVQILSQIIKLLNPEGILLVKTYESKDNPWLMDCYEAVLSAARAANVDRYNSLQVLKFKNIDPLNISERVDIFIAIKNGRWTDADNARVQSIEPTVTAFDDSLLLGSFEKIKSTSNRSVVDDVISYKSLYQNIRLKKEMIFAMLFIFFIVVLLLPYIKVTWSIVSICFFSGLLYAVVEILIIKKLSFHFPNPFMAINWVFGIFAFTFWFSNWYLSKKLKLQTSLIVLSPIIVSMLLIYLLDQDIEPHTQWFVAIIVAVASAYNFSAIINSDKQSFASLFIYNTLGFVAGSGVVFVLITKKAIDTTIYVLVFCAFYGLLSIRKIKLKRGFERNSGLP